MSAQQLDLLHLSWIRDTYPRFDTKFKGVKQFALQVKWDIMAAHDTIITNHAEQRFHANKKCHASNEYKVGDHVYLSTPNLTLPKGRVRNLVLKYIGPYKVIKAHNKAFTIMLDLPLELIARWISPTFHMGLIHRFIANNDDLFPRRDAKSFYDFSQGDMQEWLVKQITSQRWSNSKDLELEVGWMLGDTTWDLLASCKELKALGTYLELQCVTQPHNLPKCI